MPQVTSAVVTAVLLLNMKDILSTKSINLDFLIYIYLIPFVPSQLLLTVDPITKHLEHRSWCMDTPAALVLNNRLEVALLCHLLGKSDALSPLLMMISELLSIMPWMMGS